MSPKVMGECITAKTNNKTKRVHIPYVRKQKQFVHNAHYC